MSYDRYVSPLSERYASKEMQYVFSPDKKFKTWRRLWIALAETEKELGLSITQEQIDELKAHAEDINYEVAKEREKVVRHDVMSHVYAYGQQCPKAKGIIHLGATSCYVGDNTDIIVMSEALEIVRKKLINVIAELAKFADNYKNQPTLAFTHFQPAQPTTVGKRATLWMQEFLMDLQDLEYVKSTLKLLGSKGTTGTQASFLELFDGDQEKIPAQLPEGEHNDGDIDQNRQPAHRQMEQIIPKHRQSADAAGRKIGLHGEADDAAAQKQRADDIIGQHFPVVFLHNNASFCCSARFFGELRTRGCSR